jgi:hypothetical protein
MDDLDPYFNLDKHIHKFQLTHLEMYYENMTDSAMDSKSFGPSNFNYWMVKNQDVFV